MALNFSHRPVFSPLLSDENLVSSMRITNGYLIKDSQTNGDGFANRWRLNRDVDDGLDFGRERSDSGRGSQDSGSKDIIDLLPLDPFGMDIDTTVTVLTGWLEDLEGGYGASGRDEVWKTSGNCQLYAHLHFFWNNAVKLGAFPGGFDHASTAASGSNRCFQEKVAREASCNADGLVSFGNAKRSVGDVRDGKMQENKGIRCDGDGGAFHEALSFVLDYLGVRDLLVLEKVSRSLCSAVKRDPLLWRSIHIDKPLNEKITDDILLQLTSRAQGNLQCLSLVECPRITDDGLKQVLESNPRLIKLSVPGCTRLSIEGVVNNLKTFRTMSTQGVKHLRIGGLYGVSQRHFEELKFLLGTDVSRKQCARKPHLYRRGNLYLSCEDDRPIDIELCPRCQNLRLIYDCPRKSCREEERNGAQACRACTFCIARCSECGKCIIDREYEETFCLELLCRDCGKVHSKSQGREVSKIGPIGSSIHHESKGRRN